MATTAGRPIDLEQLQAELIAAGIKVNGLSMQGNLLYTMNDAGLPDDLPPEADAIVKAHIPTTALEDKITALATSAVGVTVDALTVAQRQALTLTLLYRAGAVDRLTLKIKPLDTWALPTMPAPPI